MSATIDNLHVGYEVRILKNFTDASGRKHFVDESGILRELSLDWPTQLIVFEWERDGKRETMHFPLSAKEGPRNGAMREFFELGAAAPIPLPSPAERRRKKGIQKNSKAPAAQAVTDPGRYHDGVERIEALAAAHRFDDAQVQLTALLNFPDPHGMALKSLADDLGMRASAYVDDEDRTTFEWIREKGVGLLYAWGSQATSGGEGAVYGGEIKISLRRFADLDRA